MREFLFTGTVTIYCGLFFKNNIKLMHYGEILSIPLPVCPHISPPKISIRLPWNLALEFTVKRVELIQFRFIFTQSSNPLVIIS
jgi:hypothetical protein